MRFLACLLLCLNLVACATVPRYVDLPQQGGPPDNGQVEKGDRVQVAMQDGRVFEFPVQSIDEYGISGAPGTLPWQDIQSLQVLESDGSSAMWVVLGVISAVGLAILINSAVESAATAAILNCSGC